jgi:hypothetical protein
VFGPRSFSGEASDEIDALRLVGPRGQRFAQSGGMIPPRVPAQTSHFKIFSSIDMLTT